MKQTIRENFGKKRTSYLEYDKYDGLELLDTMKTDINREGFIIADILGILNPSYKPETSNTEQLTVPSFLYMIHAIYTDECDKEEELDKEALGEFLIGKDEELVIARTQLLKVDFPEEPTDEQYDADLMRQAMFLEPFGFRNFNSICNLEYSVPFVMLNRNPIAEIIHVEALKREYHRDEFGSHSVFPKQVKVVDTNEISR